MQELSLDQSSPLVDTVNGLIDIFDSENDVCNNCFNEWVSAENQGRELPDSWKNQLSTEDDEIGYFCIETALSIVFNTVVASKIDDEQPTKYKELDNWRQKTANRYYSGINRGIYSWPFDIIENDDTIPVLTDSFDAESIAIEDHHDALGKIYHQVFDQTLRKELGEFYTSKKIINYLLDKSGYNNGVWGKRLIDPACGSGSFLISAVERLLEDKPDRISDAEAVYNICNSPSLVGFDINPFACEIARLRLFLTFYPYLNTKNEFKIQKLPIFNIDSLARDQTDLGNSDNQTLSQFTDGGSLKKEYIDEINLQKIELSDPDITENAILHELIAEYEDATIRPEASTSFGQLDRVTGRILRDNVQYDSVVGNPPYIRIQKVPEDRKPEYKQGFDSATGRFDLSVLFIEYGLESLRDGGKIAFITSNKFLTTQYGEGIRSYLRENSTIETLIDFTDTDVFDVTVLPCILAASKGNSDTNSLGYSILKQAENPDNSEMCADLLSLIDQHLTGELFEDRYTIDLNGDIETVKIRCFESNLPESKDATWTFIPSREKELIDKINNKKTEDLGSVAEKISVGIKTTANDVFVDPITESTIDEYNLEDELIYPAISGKNVSRWSIDWSSEDLKKPSYILYPHEVIDGSVEPVDLNDYPNSKKYLKEHHEQLAGRSYLQDAGRNWYECWVPQHPDYFEVDNKIITPEMASGNSFALDTTGFFCIGSCYSILLKEDSPTFHRYLTGLLNSDLMEFYLKADSSSQLYADRFRYNKSYIENLPVIYTDMSNVDKEYPDNIEEIDSIADTMVCISSLITGLHQGSVEIETAEEKINYLTYKMFNINEEEKRTIEKYLDFTSSD